MALAGLFCLLSVIEVTTYCETAMACQCARMEIAHHLVRYQTDVVITACLCGAVGSVAVRTAWLREAQAGRIILSGYSSV